MKESVSGSKIQTSISVDRALWKRFKLKMLEMLDEDSISHGVEIAIGEWLERLSERDTITTGTKVLPMSQYYFAEDLSILAETLEAAPEELRHDIQANLRRWAAQLRGDEDGESNRKGGSPSNRSTAPRKPKRPRKDTRPFKLM